MVFTLHRYIFRELIKVFVLAAVALTLIMSLGSIIGPIQKYGIGPRQVVHLIGYSLPITLTFVLPIAALFAAALVYGRFASDNELDACKASGISLLTLVYPGLTLAIVVAIANLILSFHVMPAFVQRAKKSLKADAKKILFRNIQRKGYYKMPPDGRYLIYADRANSQNDTISGVIIIELKASGIEKIITAEKAEVHFNPHKRFNEGQIIAYNISQMSSDDEGWFFFERLPITKEFPSLIGDDIKFKKIGKMKEIAHDLMLFDPIAKLARRVYAQFAAELLVQDIIGKMADDAGGSYKLHSGRRFVEFTATNCRTRDEKGAELSGKVVVKESDTDSKQLVRTLRCTKALLHIEDEEVAPTLTMELYNPTWQKQDGSTGLATGLLRIRGLILPRAVTDKLVTDNILKAISLDSIVSALQEGPSLELSAAQKKLRRKIRKTLAEIGAEIHSRLVFGIGCVSMIMIGIGLGIIKREGHLLSAFAASCVPAAILIVCIMMGKNVTKNLGANAGSGIVLMWAGLVFLSLLVVAIYRKLLRN